MLIDDIFDGEWKSNQEYCIRCPYCGDHPTHNHCYVNAEVGFFICHFCGKKGTIRQLALDYGNGDEIESGPGLVEKERHTETDFLQFRKVTGIHDQLDRQALKYLKSRGFTKELIRFYNIKFASFGRYYGRVLVPILEDGRIVCFVARSFLEGVKPKYLFPHHGETINTTSECMFGWDAVRKNNPPYVVIVEGIFDAILGSVKDGGAFIAINGKQLHNGQLFKLLKLDTCFYIMLDGDALDGAMRIARTLKGFGHIPKLCRLSGEEDPASITKERMKEVLNEAMFFTTSGEVKLLLREML